MSLCSAAAFALAVGFIMPGEVCASDAPTPAPQAQERLTVSAQFRLRGEAISGQFRPAKAPEDSLVSLRSIIMAEYDFGPLRIGGELRDARGDLEKPTSSVGVSEINAIEPLQAYVQADLVGPAGGDASLRTGRFTLELGSSRLVGTPDFSNSVVAYSGGAFKWHDKHARITAFWGMPSVREPSARDALRAAEVVVDKARIENQFFGAHTSYDAANLGVTTELYGFRLYERDSDRQQTRDRRLWTLGARVLRTPAAGHVDWDVEAAWQSGQSRATAAAVDQRDLAVDAWLAHAEVGQSFAGAWKPRVSAHFDLGTGDRSDPATYNRFDPLFPANRTAWGPIGLFGALTWSNIVSPGVRLEVAPTKRIDGSLFVRGAWLDQPADSFARTGVRDTQGESGRFAGVQAEARLRTWLVAKRLKLETGVAWLGKGSFLQSAPNAPSTGDTIYGYTDLVLQL